MFERFSQADKIKNNSTKGLANPLHHKISRLVQRIIHSNNNNRVQSSLRPFSFISY